MQISPIYVNRAAIEEAKARFKACYGDAPDMSPMVSSVIESTLINVAKNRALAESREKVEAERNGRAETHMLPDSIYGTNDPDAIARINKWLSSDVKTAYLAPAQSPSSLHQDQSADRAQADVFPGARPSLIARVRIWLGQFPALHTPPRKSPRAACAASPEFVPCPWCGSFIKNRSVPQ